MAELMRDQPDYYSTTTFPLYVEDIDADAIVVPGEGFGAQDAWSGAVEGSWALWFHQRSGQSRGFANGLSLRVDAYPSAEVILYGITDRLKTLQCCVTLDDNGLLRIRKGGLAGDLLAGPTGDPVPLSTELSYGSKGFIDSVIGAFEIWYGDRSDLANDWLVRLRVNGVDTQGGVDQYWLGSYLGLHPDIFWSHKYLRDDRAAEGGLTDLSPGYRVKVLRPEADGVYTGWRSPIGGAKYDKVDDPDEDEDATYIEAAFIDVDASVSFDMEDMPDTSIIYGVDIVSTVKRTADGETLGVVYGSTITYNAVDAPIAYARPWVSLFTDVYRAIRESLPVSLLTGITWDVDELNAAQPGGTIPSE